MIAFLSQSQTRGTSTPVAGQQAAVPKHASLRAAQRLRGGGGELVVEVGFKERAEAHAGPAQAVQTMAQAPLVADAADDQVRVLGIGREEGAGRFEAGVTRLNELLRRGQVAPDKDVHVRLRIYLLKRHGNLQEKETRLRPAGLEPATTSALETGALPLSYGRA